VDMDFHYSASFSDRPLPEAYERLLLDAMRGDASLFARNDEIELAWKLIDPLLHRDGRVGLPEVAAYNPGSWGPDEADKLLERDGRIWRMGCLIHEPRDFEH